MSTLKYCEVRMNAIARTLLVVAFAWAGLASADEVTYLHTDVLGSPIAATDENGTLLWEERYEPYGERYYEPAAASGNKRSFTGHAEDSGGLVYAGARYYNPEIGRFYQVDPLFKADEPTHSGSRYSYANDNPFRFTDPDGRWPTEIHNQIINVAFPGLTPLQRSFLMAGSANVDSVIFGGQSVANSAEHGMRQQGQSAADAIVDTDRFIRFMVGAANGGKTPFSTQVISEFSLRAAGKAMHPATDRTSPEHTDASGNPKIWKGLAHPIEAQRHADGEAVISPAEMNQAVDAARAVFENIYGPALLQQAITPSGR